ncbi:hypothetical protein H2198_009832 [Neophaeococcomyces mojaviensis]|uniref:Uncharacterized protein n=1 Tax=Neophaeococcomyces mojaviensis TaxID=3383035 RepID=A0ACC2ZTM8_9EURO|nr:hypothetical protein H2198_009832 [Knufia sp. JES_112]
MRVWFPEGTFNGVQDFQLQFAHTVVDTSFGECPEYCYLSKFAAMNLSYPGMPNWECDIESGTCEQTLNTTVPAPIYMAVD